MSYRTKHERLTAPSFDSPELEAAYFKLLNAARPTADSIYKEVGTIMRTDGSAHSIADLTRSIRDTHSRGIEIDLQFLDLPTYWTSNVARAIFDKTRIRTALLRLQTEGRIEQVTSHAGSRPATYRYLTDAMLEDRRMGDAARKASRDAAGEAVRNLDAALCAIGASLPTSSFRFRNAGSGVTSVEAVGLDAGWFNAAADAIRRVTKIANGES